jgi:hypothetical protein
MVSSGLLRHLALVRTDVSEEPGASETSVLLRATRHNNPEDTILHSHRRENVKSYKIIVYWVYGWQKFGIVSSPISVSRPVLPADRTWSVTLTLPQGRSRELAHSHVTLVHISQTYSS